MGLHGSISIDVWGYDGDGRSIILYVLGYDRDGHSMYGAMIGESV